MAMRKYQKVEKAQVLDEEEHQKLGKALQKTGKKSVAELDEGDRKEVLESLDKS